MKEREDSCIAGSKIGGLKAAKKNLENDPNFYKRIGAIGGKKGTTGGFAANPELARTAGRKAGEISRRGMKFIKEDNGVRTYIAQDTGMVVEYMYDSNSKEYKRKN